MSWPFQPKSPKRSALPSVRLFMIPRSRRGGHQRCPVPSLPVRIRRGRRPQNSLTYDRFAGVESLPQPGPVYVHAEACERYSEHAGFPEELRGSPRTVEAYAHGRRLRPRNTLADGEFEPAIEKLLAHPNVDYLQVNSTPLVVSPSALSVPPLHERCPGDSGSLPYSQSPSIAALCFFSS